MLETSTAEANLLGMSNPAVKPCQLLKISEGWFGGQSPPLICPSRKRIPSRFGGETVPVKNPAAGRRLTGRAFEATFDQQAIPKTLSELTATNELWSPFLIATKPSKRLRLSSASRCLQKP